MVTRKRTRSVGSSFGIFNNGVRVHFLIRGFLFFRSLSTLLLLSLMHVPDINNWIDWRLGIMNITFLHSQVVASCHSLVPLPICRCVSLHWLTLQEGVYPSPHTHHSNNYKDRNIFSSPLEHKSFPRPFPSFLPSIHRNSNSRVSWRPRTTTTTAQEVVPFFLPCSTGNQESNSTRCPLRSHDNTSSRVCPPCCAH